MEMGTAEESGSFSLKKHSRLNARTDVLVVLLARITTIVVQLGENEKGRISFARFV